MQIFTKICVKQTDEQSTNTSGDALQVRLSAGSTGTNTWRYLSKANSTHCGLPHVCTPCSAVSSAPPLGSCQPPPAPPSAGGCPHSELPVVPPTLRGPSRYCSHTSKVYVRRDTPQVNPLRGWCSGNGGATLTPASSRPSPLGAHAPGRLSPVEAPYVLIVHHAPGC